MLNKASIVEYNSCKFMIFCAPDDINMNNWNDVSSLFNNINIAVQAIQR